MPKPGTKTGTSGHGPFRHPPSAPTAERARGRALDLTITHHFLAPPTCAEQQRGVEGVAAGAEHFTGGFRGQRVAGRHRPFLVPHALLSRICRE